MTDIEYAKLTKDILNYIIAIRTEEPDMELMDIIFSYCFKNDLDVELVGDAISQDQQFKELIEMDINANKKKDVDLDEW